MIKLYRVVSEAPKFERMKPWDKRETRKKRKIERCGWFALRWSPGWNDGDGSWLLELEHGPYDASFWISHNDILPFVDKRCLEQLNSRMNEATIYWNAVEWKPFVTQWVTGQGSGLSQVFRGVGHCPTPSHRWVFPKLNIGHRITGN